MWFFYLLNLLDRNRHRGEQKADLQALLKICFSSIHAEGVCFVILLQNATCDRIQEEYNMVGVSTGQIC